MDSIAEDANPVLEDEEVGTCVYCKKTIRRREWPYKSRQAGMKGLYHWDCFITACRRANQAGAVVIETILVIHNSYEVIHDYED